MRLGAAAAPRWWGIEPDRMPGYLLHLSRSGATAVELIVHHGPASRDPSTIHLDRGQWPGAIAEAWARDLHVDVHNSLDPRFQLGRWADDASGLRADLSPVLTLLGDIENIQSLPPAFVVHAADGCDDPERATAEALTWISTELDSLGSSAVVCVEQRPAIGVGDDRFDRDLVRLAGFVDWLHTPRIGVCWDVANDWLTAYRCDRPYELPAALPMSVRHVHLHDSPGGEALHGPLGDERIPWADAVGMLADVGWVGTTTLEIRYRLAHDVGDPWTVLAESFRRVLSVRK